MNIYIGNLNYDISEDELMDIFKEYGEVASVKIIIDKYSGRSKGFGFIDMPNDQEASEAMENINDTDIKGRRIKVNQARERNTN